MDLMERMSIGSGSVLNLVLVWSSEHEPVADLLRGGALCRIILRFVGYIK